ncbi:MAG: putative glyoxalase superfamily protein PhnB [Cyclobacteriaceae bacterium]|jgi:PhnB protein
MIPKGLHSVNPYFFVADPAHMILFLQEAFGAKEMSRTSDQHIIKNVILLFDDASVMLAQSSSGFETKAAGVYLYVEDVDVSHRRALDAGGVEVFPPDDMDYGDRQSGIQDPSGNFWWISKRLVHQDYPSKVS